MNALYARMSDLPPRLQMFMAGCPAELEAKRDRINRRQVVTRILLALAEGVRRTAYWNLAPCAFEVDRSGRGPLLVLWDHRDAFDGEDEPPVTVTLPARTATVIDAFGRTRSVRSQDGRIQLTVADTPLFVEEN